MAQHLSRGAREGQVSTVSATYAGAAALQSERNNAKPEAGTLPNGRGVLAFGPFKLDPMRRTLTRDGVPVPLTTRLFETLLYLAQHPERPIARDELENAVWHGRVVEEGNLRKAISALRKTLQTGAQGENYIVTIAGHGFQFTAPVLHEPYDADASTTLEATALTAHDTPAGVPSAPGPQRAWQRTITVKAALAALLFTTGVTILDLNIEQFNNPKFLPPPHSVAVLPFINMSSDPKQDYFSDGLADELINTLSRVGGLRVAARTSAFTFRGSTATISEIGRRLNVAAILEGAVRRDGQRIHIAVQLIDTRTGFQFWSRSYDRNRLSGDTLSVQTDIAKTVSASLEIRLMQADAAQLTVGGTHNPQAFDAYLRGMNNSVEYGEANLRQAISDFTAAIALDPTYAQAFAGRAASHNLLVAYGYETDARNGQQEPTDETAIADADTAIRLAPTLAEAHRVKGIILFDTLKFKGAAEELAMASDLAPNDARVEATHGAVEARLGYNDAAIATERHAIALDPLNPNAYLRLGQALYWGRHFDEALEAFGHATALDQHPSRNNLAWTAFTYLAKGDLTAAEHICVGGNGYSDYQILAIAYHALGRQAEAETQLAKLRQAVGDRAAYNYAQIYAQWGQAAEALRWLETAYTLGDTGLNEIKVSPLLDPIRKFAEFTDIERRLNFPR